MVGDALIEVRYHGGHGRRLVLQVIVELDEFGDHGEGGFGRLRLGKLLEQAGLGRDFLLVQDDGLRFL